MKKINQKCFFLWIVGVFACHFPSMGGSPKPNILWIVANDLGTDLGCYGNQQVKTPHLDQLAREGIVYENFFTVGAVCSPSRSAFITGMYATSINSHNQFTKFKKPLPDPVIPVTRYFKDAGYFVANSRGIQMENTSFYTGYNFLHQAEELYDGTDWRQRAEGQPFFAQVHLTYAHRPFKADPEHPVDPEEVVIPAYYPDHPLVRKDWALYLETIQLLDRQIGAVLKRLEEDGLAENTVVFFFADHGRPHIRGKQFLYDGGINTPLIVRWPTQLSPGARTVRLVSNIDLAPTAMQLAGIDIPGYMQGRDFLGKNSKPRTHVLAMRDRCDGTLDRIRTVRTKDFKYIRNFFPDRPYTQFNGYKKWAYPVLTLMQVMYKQGKLTPEQARFIGPERPAEELYDLHADPFELHNLAKDPAYQDKTKELRKVLDIELSAVDLADYPEDSAEIVAAQNTMKREYVNNMRKKGLDPDIPDEDYLKYWLKELAVENPGGL